MANRPPYRPGNPPPSSLRRRRPLGVAYGAARGAAPVRPRAAPRPSQAPAVLQPPPVMPAAAPLTTALQQQAGMGLSGGVGAYDLASDPAVAAAQGLAAKMRATAQAQALAKTQQAAIEYGDPTGVQGLDQKTIDAAKGNPFSVLSNLQHGYDTGTQNLEEGLNKANLFYSGYRGQQLGEAARGYQDARYQAGTRFHGLLTDVQDQLANALLGADQYEQNAMLGSSGGSYDGGGGYDSYSSGSSASDLRAALGIRPATGPYVLPRAPVRKNPYPSSFVNIRSTRGI